MNNRSLVASLKALVGLAAVFLVCASAFPDSGQRESANPFFKFIGEWTLKADNWNQNGGHGMEHIKIPNHHTLCKILNTDNSLLWVVDSPSLHGHIFWSYNPVRKSVAHLSSFGTDRSGVGQGSVNENGDVTLKVSFQGEPEGSYRIYHYHWISADEYELQSTQYDRHDKPTGGFYGGTFVRLSRDQLKEKDTRAIKGILKVIDDNNADLPTKLSVYTDDVIHMAPNNGVITSKVELGHHLEETKKHGYADMTHEIREVFSFENIVLMRGGVVGTYYPKDGSPSFRFRTKNLFVFRRQEDGTLKVWQVIFNPSPND